MDSLTGSPALVRNIQSKFALISVGGHGSWDEPLDSGEIYDPINNRWVEIARLPADFGPVCSGTVCNCMFYVYSETDKLAGFDLEKGCSMMIQVHRPPLRLPDYYPKLVSCQTRLFMLCVSWCDYDGLLNRREKAVRKMWELDLKSHAWSEVSRHLDAPMDWNASFFADQNKIYGVEMFRIFGQVLDFVTACNVSDSEIKWSTISRKHAAHEADASSCITKENGIGEQAKPKKKALPHANDNEEESPTSVKLKIREGKLMIWNGRYCSSASFLLSRAKLVRSILLQRSRHNANTNKELTTSLGYFNSPQGIAHATIQHHFPTPSTFLLGKLSHLIFFASLTAPVINDEIKAVIFFAPSFEFCKCSWYIIGLQICNAVKNFFYIGHLPKGVKVAAITLISKCSHATNITNFRTISLCNMFYKILAKLLANRLTSILPIIIS
ncbi:hypothetical protein KFK09_011016 [Dendrobium nobile]|uniref:F-box/kelch-repeat protein n=1 Tax=Dendrobium nobile TaxID=94219 RepID=A0A8T3BES3_DENNO|nr:hypothetical protein KFK09_011016 [Dendrobium nobile]